MLDRTWKRVGHGREREVGGGRRGIQGEEKWGKFGQHVTNLLTKNCMVAYEW